MVGIPVLVRHWIAGTAWIIPALVKRSSAVFTSPTSRATQLQLSLAKTRSRRLNPRCETSRPSLGNSP